LAVRKALFLWGNFLLKGVAGIFVYSKFEEWFPGKAKC
jgi:hypothetical protein